MERFLDVILLERSLSWVAELPGLPIMILLLVWSGEVRAVDLIQCLGLY